MVVQADSSLKNKSSDDLKQMLEEQTSKLEVAPEEEATKAVEEPEEEVEVSTPTETSPKEKAVEEKLTEEPKDTLYKIKVGSVEKEVNLEKLIRFAQEGIDYPTKMQRLNEEKRRFEEEKAKLATTPVDYSKLNEQFVDMLQKDTLGALTTLYEAKKNDEKRQEMEERREERAFLSEKKNLPHWDAIETDYQELRDSGMSRKEAFLEAQDKYLLHTIATIREKGFKEGAEKTSLKEKAKIPIEEKKTKGGVLPPLEELGKMTSEQIAKYLKFNKTPGW